MIREAVRRKRRRSQPLEVHLTLRMNFGDAPADALTVIDNRRVPMVGSVFEYRDRIVRGFATLLVKTGLSQPRVARELFPVVRLLRRS